jgi:hypothetical protein
VRQPASLAASSVMAVPHGSAYFQESSPCSV